MGQFETGKIRNLGIIAHGGAGKTSLAEAILFNTGMIDRLGRVDDGTSTMDFEPEEIKRKISITSALDHCEWNGHSIHIVDTPGYGNFIADTRACMRALDCAVVILSAISGRQGPDRGDLELGQRVRDPAHRLCQQDGP